MKVAIYKKDGTFATVLEDIESPRISDNEIIFNGGSISGINDNHILLEDTVEPPETIEEAKVLDQKAQYTYEKVDRVAELEAQLQAAREENELNAMAIMELAELVLGG